MDVELMRQDQTQKGIQIKMHASKPKSSRCYTGPPMRFILCLSLGLFFAPILCAQPADEHASHHPGAAGAGAMPAAPGAAPAVGAAPAAGGMGGMMEGMGEMMKGMHGVPPKELYPTLMALPELSPEQRKLVEAQAAERMHAGSVNGTGARHAQRGHAIRRLRRDARSHHAAARRHGAT